MEKEMNFDIIEWCKDNFTKEEIDFDWIDETSRQILISKYWKANLPQGDFCLQSNGYSEPMSDLDWASEQP